jgi:hypothetical protein
MMGKNTLRLNCCKQLLHSVCFLQLVMRQGTAPQCLLCRGAASKVITVAPALNLVALPRSQNDVPDEKQSQIHHAWKHGWGGA